MFWFVKVESTAKTLQPETTTKQLLPIQLNNWLCSDQDAVESKNDLMLFVRHIPLHGLQLGKNKPESVLPMKWVVHHTLKGKQIVSRAASLTKT